jgi:hypothetical protein
MINKENNAEQPENEKPVETGFIDTAKMDVQCHILIKDKDTGEVLINQRG